MRKCEICDIEIVKKINTSNRQYQCQRYCGKVCEAKGKAAGRSTFWKGEDALYETKHRWVSNHKGRPQFCEHCKRTDRKKYEWANIDNKYRRVLDDYIRLCTSCHRKYDYRFFKPKFDVEEAKRLKSIGYSYRKIARTLGVGAHGTIQKQLEPNFPNYNKTY